MLTQIQETQDSALVKEILLWLCSTHGQKSLFSGLEIFFSKASPGGLWCTPPNLVAPEMASVEMNGVMRRGEVRILT